jgi:hypothetical protein
VGSLVAIWTIEDLLMQKKEMPSRSAAEWWRIVEHHHTWLGEKLASQWALPPTVRQVIGAHHGGPVGDFPKHVATVMTADIVVSLMGAQGLVSATDLRSATSLTEAQCASVEEALPRLPGIVASFEGDQRATSSPSAVLQATVTPPTPTSAPFQLKILVQARRLCTGLEMTEKTLTFSCDEALPTNYVFELELESEARFWVKVATCEPLGAGFLVIAAPFALSNSMRPGWHEVMRRLAARAQAAPASAPAGT